MTPITTSTDENLLEEKRIINLKLDCGQAFAADMDDLREIDAELYKRELAGITLVGTGYYLGNYQSNS